MIKFLTLPFDSKIKQIYIFLKLYEEGFRITRCVSDDKKAEMYRFFWQKTNGINLIEDMADIDIYLDYKGVKHASTLFSGSSKSLD